MSFPTPTSTPTTYGCTRRTIAFAFDIDGVLVRSKTPLPGAAESLKLLQQLKVPFIFLTNGGGSTEKDHVELLGKRLSMAGLHERQFIQSHSPFHALVPRFTNKNILVLGGHGNKIRDVAHAYGFKQVITSADVANRFVDIYPFLEMECDHHAEHGREIEHYLPDGRIQVAAVLIWSSPRSWGLDSQLVIDLLLSEKGILGTLSSKNSDTTLPNRGYLRDDQPQIFSCNPDLTWATSYKLPRHAQGGFMHSLRGMWEAHTDKADLSSHIVSYGKPTTETYLYAEGALQNWHGEINGEEATPISTVYMVGDNPASDIQGANSFQSRHGSEWKSILVESGIHVAGTEPAHRPDHVVLGVKEAVELALEMHR